MKSIVCQLAEKDNRFVPDCILFQFSLFVKTIGICLNSILLNKVAHLTNSYHPS